MKKGNHSYSLVGSLLRAETFLDGDTNGTTPFGYQKGHMRLYALRGEMGVRDIREANDGMRKKKV